MRIVIDMQGVQGGSKYRGIGRYTRSFIHSFIQQSAGHEVYLLVNMLLHETALEIKEDYKTLIPHNHIVPFYAVGPVREVYPSNAWNIHTSELIREKLLYDLNVDFVIVTSLFEGLSDNSILSIGKYTFIPTATIFYDLIPSIYPEKFLKNPLKKLWYERKLDSLKRSTILLAISDSASQEAVDYLHYSSKNVYTISSASNMQEKIYTPNTQLLQKDYGITRPYLLHTSAYEERKNFEGLIEAYSLISESLRKEYQLVLVCKLKSHQRQNLENHINACKLKKDEVILTGFVDDDVLLNLYHSCYLFVFPSWHEGFGLPVLEAMSCGAATIGSNVSSIPEVIGCDEALFDPKDVHSIKEKITEVLNDKIFWKKLKTHASKQASKFSWQTTAKLALDALVNHHKQNPHVKHHTSVFDSTRTLISAIADETKKTLVPLDSNLMNASLAIEQNERTIYKLLPYLNVSSKPTWRIEGPFDSSYSLALLNRETALALTSLGYNVSLHSTEGHGDFEPSASFLNTHPLLAKLHRNALLKDAKSTDILSRNLYPPRVTDMHASTNMLHHYAWEESGFPVNWVKDFNACLTGMTCLSSHVEKIMIDNGVNIPLEVSGCGVDHWERIDIDENYTVEARDFRFLHVSSCFPRKGVDVLLKAYAKQFSNEDNVTLIIKTFKNPHNQLHTWLKEARQEHSSFPHVLIIEEDLSDATLKALYTQCDVLVAPSRAEGFGLPMAEAMLSGLAVITTGWGGQLDFCTNDTAWLIDYTFQRADTHFNLYDSVWAEPSTTHLASLMQTLYIMPPSQRINKSLKGRTVLLNTFKWTDVCKRLIDSAAQTSSENKRTIASIGWISTWHAKCGIASYSEHLLSSDTQSIAILANTNAEILKKDDAQVHRCWEAGDGDALDTLTHKIDLLALNTLVIQFNYSFFDFIYFKNFLEGEIMKGRIIIIMFHATTDSPLTPHKQLSTLVPVFKRCARLLVHTPHDLNKLKTYGLVENVTLFPHGILDFLPPNFSPPLKKENTHFTLATYGFFLPHKGLLEIIEVLHLLKSKGYTVKLKMINAAYPVAVSKNLIEEAKSKIAAHNLSQEITLVTEYLSDEASLAHLAQADLIIFPYQATGESSSAAVRYGLASHTPIAVTPLDIFEDVKSTSYTLLGTHPEQMAKSIENILYEITHDTDIAKSNKVAAEKWRQAHKYSHLAKRLYHMIDALQQKK